MEVSDLDLLLHGNLAIFDFDFGTYELDFRSQVTCRGVAQRSPLLLLLSAMVQNSRFRIISTECLQRLLQHVWRAVGGDWALSGAVFKMI